MSSIDIIADKPAKKERKRPVGRQAGSAGLDDLVESLRSILARTGSMPPERTVAEELSVKRHTLRRALGLMRARGELEPARAGRRASTEAGEGRSLINSTNPLEVMELRLMLEPSLARLAALRASPMEIERIRRAATTAQGADPNTADMTFHKAIAAGSRNSLASELYVILHRVANDGRLRFTDSDASLVPERVRQRDAEHCLIAEAIASRDPEAAERSMRQHLVAIQQKIMGRLAPGSAY
ncbi:FadR/GntR family transcriptional regulator [Chthonobacter albigriseus]|uniref:FadR/GntR family transcriptional regulator n=1 Tax=Chthonobacter albigriseus TaxID=1683161 RepID=UPI0015EE62A7|nr:FCD domain-containing protein [Chthonobacter albigriseus]